MNFIEKIIFYNYQLQYTQNHKISINLPIDQNYNLQGSLNQWIQEKGLVYFFVLLKKIFFQKYQLKLLSLRSTFTKKIIWYKILQ